MNRLIGQFSDDESFKMQVHVHDFQNVMHLQIRVRCILGHLIDKPRYWDILY